MKIIFFGTPEFGSVSLKKMIESGYRPALVVTNPDQPVGREKKITESPVSRVAKEDNVPIIKPKKIAEALEEIKKINPDLMVVAAYGKYLPLSIINIPKYGILNVHPSLLPKYRGSSPIQYAILNGDKKTGITIIMINEEMDKGDILAQKEYEIKENENYEELLNRLTSLGAELLVETIPRWINGEIKAKKQDDSQSVYSKILDRYDGKIDWKNSAEQIARQARAFNPWPGSYTYFSYKGSKKENLLKVLEGGVLKQTNSGPFGTPGKTYVAPNGKIAVQTGKDFFLIQKFQIEGKKPMKTEDYLRGNIDLIGLTLK